VNGRAVEVRGEGAAVASPPTLVPPWIHEVGTTAPIVVGPDSIFVLSDNPNVYRDSREFGSIPQAWITGVVAASIWPPSRVR